ncbi:MAG: DUF3473 domain-containing protein [Nitrospirae bacterium]|nr:DUF3473 domain-containing protein [Nitrospirota bacterium]
MTTADSPRSGNGAILITVDVEDWFQVENFKGCIPFDSWPQRELRVERSTHELLEFLGRHDVRATFFVLGWLCDKMPGLLREIHAHGHEIASHGHVHELCTKQSPKELRRDLADSKKALEDTVGVPVKGYRAASFSITDDAVAALAECGYTYDSSYNSSGVNERHGKIAMPQAGDSGKTGGIAVGLPSGIRELPISNLKAAGRIIPWGGGGYFRLIPSPLFRAGVRSILDDCGAYLFYMHPWEIDPGQPRVSEASAMFRFMHYLNLDRTLKKLGSFVTGFKDCRFITCAKYLDGLGSAPV